MNIQRLSVWGLVVLSFATIPALTLAQTHKPPTDSNMRRLIVRYKDAGTERVVSLESRSYQNAFSGKSVSLSHLKSVTEQAHVLVSDKPLTRAEMVALTQEIAKDPRVAFAEIDEWMYPHGFVPNDTSFASQQWNLKSPAVEPGGANLPNAWWRKLGGTTDINGSGVTVAVLDTGYRPHAEIAVNLVTGYDFVGPNVDPGFITANDGDGRDTDAQDPGDWNPSDRIVDSEFCAESLSSWHGTRVAGIIAAVGNNNTGVIGVAYGAKILPVRVMGVCGGYSSDIADGIRWAAGIALPGVPANANVAKVINLSLGAPGTCNPAGNYQAAITAARAAGSVIVASSGNDGAFSIGQPANCSGVIAVTAHTRIGDKANYANIGTGTTISAPGGGRGSSISGDGSLIYTTSNSGANSPVADSFAGGRGTSFSAPHVSAVAALLFQIDPTLTPDDVQTYLTNNVRPHPAGTYCASRSDCGAGLLDAFKAVQSLLTAKGYFANTAPTMPAIAPQTATAAGTLQFTVTGSDADGDDVSFNISGLPSGATFNSATGVFHWGYALPGTYSVVITPTDGSANGTARTASVTVTGTLPAPSSAGGGGGAMQGAELIALVLLALGCSIRRKH
jgi:serine protease